LAARADYFPFLQSELPRMLTRKAVQRRTRCSTTVPIRSKTVSLRTVYRTVDNQLRRPTVRVPWPSDGTVRLPVYGTVRGPSTSSTPDSPTAACRRAADLATGRLQRGRTLLCPQRRQRPALLPLVQVHGGPREAGPDARAGTPRRTRRCAGELVVWARRGVPSHSRSSRWELLVVPCVRVVPHRSAVVI